LRREAEKLLWGRLVVPVVCGSLLSAAPVAGQTIGGAVKDHADEHLQTKKKNEKKRSSNRSHRSSGRSPPSSSWVSRPPPPKSEDDEPKGPKLPLRVIGKDLELEPQIAGGYRGWYAQQYPTVEVDNQGYFTWAFQLRAKLFRLISLDS